MQTEVPSAPGEGDRSPPTWYRWAPFLGKPPPLKSAAHERQDEAHKAKTAEALKVDQGRWQVESETPGQTAMSLQEYLEGFEDRLSEEEFEELAGGIIRDEQMAHLTGRDPKAAKKKKKRRGGPRGFPDLPAFAKDEV